MVGTTAIEPCAFTTDKFKLEERNLIENAIPKSTRAVTKWSVEIFLEWQNGRHYSNRALRLHN